MKKKIRKKTQTTLLNIKGAGRPAIHDPGIRHTERLKIEKLTSLHLTVKIKKIKADLKNKIILTILKRAIKNARKKGLRIIHYSLEYDHIHLLAETENNDVLGKGMQSFGVTMGKAINRLRKLGGEVYKHRYHLRKIKSGRELKNVMNYIFTNGIKHKTAREVVNPYNSIQAEIKYHLFYQGKMTLDLELMEILDTGIVFYRSLEYI
jgi:REP element-mobilizing transposase RayT